MGSHHRAKLPLCVAEPVSFDMSISHLHQSPFLGGTRVRIALEATVMIYEALSQHTPCTLRPSIIVDIGTSLFSKIEADAPEPEAGPLATLLKIDLHSTPLSPFSRLSSKYPEYPETRVPSRWTVVGQYGLWNMDGGGTPPQYRTWQDDVRA